MHGKHSAHAYWKVLENSISPFNVTGFKGNCNFPQISEEGLEDSWQHGHDIYGVYHDLLHFLPRQLDLKKVSFRVTNNVITSQVAGMLINGMYGVKSNVPLLVEVSRSLSLDLRKHSSAHHLLPIWPIEVGDHRFSKARLFMPSFRRSIQKGRRSTKHPMVRASGPYQESVL